MVEKLNIFEESANYQNTVVTILNMLAYTQFSGFEVGAKATALAPNIKNRIHLAKLAVSKFANYQKIQQYCLKKGHDVEKDLTKLAEDFADFQTRTNAKSWTEMLMNVYIFEEMLTTFFTQISKTLTQEDQEFIKNIFTNNIPQNFEQQIITIMQNNKHEAALVALWGRRLAGEVVKQIQETLTSLNFAQQFLENNTSKEKIISEVTASYTRKIKKLNITA